MTIPITESSSLVPRRREEWDQDDAGGDANRDGDRVFAGYAPPGAEWQARVRHLPEDGATSPLLPVTVDPQPRSSGGVQVIRDEGNKLVLRIEAEVTVLGELPGQGVTVETVTVLRRPDKAGEKP